jgi:hypothetical protein
MASVNYMTPKQMGGGASLTDQLAAYNKANGVSSSAFTQPSPTAPAGDFMHGLSGALSGMGSYLQSGTEEPFSYGQKSQYQPMQDFSQKYNNQMMNALKVYYQSIPTSMNYPKVGGR